MADIAMSYQAVSQLKKQSAFLQTGFETFTKNFNTTAENIMNGWSGKAQKDFAAKCEAVLPTLTSISELLGKYSTVIGEAVCAQQNLDAAEAARMGKLAF